MGHVCVMCICCMCFVCACLTYVSCVPVICMRCVYLSAGCVMCLSCVVYVMCLLCVSCICYACVVCVVCVVSGVGAHVVAGCTHGASWAAGGASVLSVHLTLVLPTALPPPVGCALGLIHLPSFLALPRHFCKCCHGLADGAGMHTQNKAHCWPLADVTRAWGAYLMVWVPVP